MEKGLSEFLIGAFFCINAVGYIIGSLLVSKVHDMLDNKLMIFSGMVVAGFCSFLIGPSPYLPDELWIMCVGQFTLGIFTIFFQVTSLPEMINDVVRKYPDRKFEASDISSGVFNAMLGMGQMLSPIYGSYMTEVYGFRICADSVGALLIIYAIIYFLLCIGFTYLNDEHHAFQVKDAIARNTVAEHMFEAMGTKSVGRNRGSK